MSFIGGQQAAALTPPQIYALMLKHGFKPGQEAATATAVALAESAGIPNNFNPNDEHGGSVGLMQINGANAHLIGGDDWKTQGTNPYASVAAAKQLYDKSGFSPWGAYTDGSYKKYLDQANAAAAAPAVEPPPPDAYGYASSTPNAVPGTSLASVPNATTGSVAPDAPSVASLLGKGDFGGAATAFANNPSLMSGLSGLAGGGKSGGGGQQAPAAPNMPIPNVPSTAGQVAQMSPQLMAQIMARQQQQYAPMPQANLARRIIPGLSLGGYGGN